MGIVRLLLASYFFVGLGWFSACSGATLGHNSGDVVWDFGLPSDGSVDEELTGLCAAYGCAEGQLDFGEQVSLCSHGLRQRLSSLTPDDEAMDAEVLAFFGGSPPPAQVQPVVILPGGPSEVGQAVDQPADVSFKCPHCNLDCNRKNNYKRHIRRFHSNKAFQCSLCTYSYEEAGKLAAHMLKTHKITQPPLAPRRTKPEKLCESLTLETVVSEGVLQCPVPTVSCQACPAWFMSNAELNKHVFACHVECNNQQPDK